MCDLFPVLYRFQVGGRGDAFVYPYALGYGMVKAHIGGVRREEEAALQREAAQVGCDILIVAQLYLQGLQAGAQLFRHLLRPYV